MSRFYTDEPVKDAERHQMELERQCLHCTAGEDGEYCEECTEVENGNDL